MMDQQVFPTKKEAIAAIAKMRGWNARPVQLYLPSADDPTRVSPQWVVEVRTGGDPQYLRKDGYVR